MRPGCGSGREADARKIAQRSSLGKDDETNPKPAKQAAELSAEIIEPQTSVVRFTDCDAAWLLIPALKRWDILISSAIADDRATSTYWGNAVRNIQVMQI